jgi:Zn finger protein HypA/HybF involved in hydrogenase expression
VGAKSKTPKVKCMCVFCGKVFLASFKKVEAMSAECPKCGESDYEVIGEG